MRPSSGSCICCAVVAFACGGTSANIRGQGVPNAACDRIAATFRGLPADTVELTAGRVENPLSHVTEPGCRVEARGDVRRLPAPQLPEAVFLKSLDWDTDSRYAADGDFSGNVAVRREDALCFIDTEWNGEGEGSAPDLPDRGYRIVARCVLEAGVPAPRPPPNRPSDGAPGRPAGLTEKVLTPAAPPRFTNVVAGEGFTCALAETRRVYCWGSRLANGSTRDEEFPQPVRGDHEFTAVAAGDAHVCALDLAGRAYCWGFGLTGALGGSTDSTAIPVPVTTPARFVAISAGPERTCAIDQDGSLYCWGRFSLPSTRPEGHSSPRPVAVQGGVRFREVSAGGYHTCGIGADGRIYCWGSNYFGERGAGAVGGPTTERVSVALAEVKQISTSPTHSCALDKSGVAYCWGRNRFGELGIGRAGQSDEPTAAPALVVDDHRWRLIRSGGSVTCGLTEDAAAFCWGANFYPQRLGSAAAPDRCDGPPPRECSSRPVLVTGGLRFRDLAVGAGHTCGVTTGGEVYCWGDYGQPGSPAVEPRALVFKATPPPH